MSVIPAVETERWVCSWGKKMTRDKNLGGINCGYNYYSERTRSLRERGEGNEQYLRWKISIFSSLRATQRGIKKNSNEKDAEQTRGC